MNETKAWPWPRFSKTMPWCCVSDIDAHVFSPMKATCTLDPSLHMQPNSFFRYTIFERYATISITKNLSQNQRHHHPAQISRPCSAAVHGRHLVKLDTTLMHLKMNPTTHWHQVLPQTTNDSAEMCVLAINKDRWVQCAIRQSTDPDQVRLGAAEYPSSKEGDVQVTMLMINCCRFVCRQAIMDQKWDSYGWRYFTPTHHVRAHCAFKSCEEPILVAAKNCVWSVQSRAAYLPLFHIPAPSLIRPSVWGTLSGHLWCCGTCPWRCSSMERIPAAASWSARRECRWCSARLGPTCAGQWWIWARALGHIHRNCDCWLWDRCTWPIEGGFGWVKAQWKVRPLVCSCRQTPRTGNHTPLAVHPRPQLPGVFHR